MKRALAIALSTAVLATSSLPAIAADSLLHFTRGNSFDQNTMMGWQRSVGPSALAYGSVKFDPTKKVSAHFGLAMTAPYRVNGAGVLLHTQAPKFADLRFTTHDTGGTWGSALNLGGARAWTYDPTAPVGERHTHFLDSGKSWIIVGLASVAIGVGIFAITENGT